MFWLQQNQAQQLRGIKFWKLYGTRTRSNSCCIISLDRTGPEPGQHLPSSTLYCYRTKPARFWFCLTHLNQIKPFSPEPEKFCSGLEPEPEQNLVQLDPATASLTGARTSDNWIRTGFSSVPSDPVLLLAGWTEEVPPPTRFLFPPTRSGWVQTLRTRRRFIVDPTACLGQQNLLQAHNQPDQNLLVLSRRNQEVLQDQNQRQKQVQARFSRTWKPLQIRLRRNPVLIRLRF